MGERIRPARRAPARHRVSNLNRPGLLEAGQAKGGADEVSTKPGQLHIPATSPGQGVADTVVVSLRKSRERVPSLEFLFPVAE